MFWSGSIEYKKIRLLLEKELTRPYERKKKIDKK